jgi:hypothetical protein
MASGAVSWMSKLQSIIALSTTEAEFIAAVTAGQELLLFCQFFTELGYNFTRPSPMFMDNQSAMQVAKNPEHYGCMKHLHLRYFWLWDEVNRQYCIEISYIPTVNLFVPEPPCTAGNSSRGWLGACLTVDEVRGSQVIAGTEMVRQSTRDAREGEEGD